MSASNENGKVPGVWVAARFVPFAQTISAQARAVLALTVDPDGHLLPRAADPALDDLAGWAEARKHYDTVLEQMFGPPAAASRATAETADLNGVTVHIATPPKLASTERAYLDIHGGGMIFGGGAPCMMGAQIAAGLHGVRAYAVDYRLPPDHPYPAALDDCVTVYRALLESHQPENIVIGGLSGGGNLAAALTLRARDEGLPLPAALVLLTPELDLTESGDSFQVNRTVDVMLQDGLAGQIKLYAAGHELTHPYLSPLFGDFTKGFPPTFLHAGTRDLFLSNAVRMHRALRRAGLPSELHIMEGLPHMGFLGTLEDDELYAEVARFVADHWGRRT